jgi:hypothetical protein
MWQGKMVHPGMYHWVWTSTEGHRTPVHTTRTLDYGPGHPSRHAGSLGWAPGDVAEVSDLSARGDNSDLAKDDPCDPTTTSKPEAPMQSLNQLPVVTDLADARSA